MAATIGDSIMRALFALKARFTGRPAKQSLTEWLRLHPEIAEESRQGFQDLREGRYRKVSRGHREA